MLHELEHAAGNGCTVYTVQFGMAIGYAAWSWTCSLDANMDKGMDLTMLHVRVHVHAVRQRLHAMFMSMLSGHGHAAYTRTCCMSTSMLQTDALLHVRSM